MLEKRLEILLDPLEYEKLKLYASSTGKSVGELVREAVRNKYVVPADQAREEAVRRLVSPDLEEDWPEWSELKKIITREAGGIDEAD